MLALGPIASAAYIKVGEQVVLGGQQRGACRVKVRHSGPAPLSIAERRPGGTIEERGRLKPGQRAALAFGAGSSALVRDPGNRQAEPDAEITGDASVNRGMSYGE